MARPGRKRKDGERQANGRLVARERQAYTAETIAKRKLRLVADADPLDKAAGYPLGILWLRGQITAAEHNIGLHYAALHAKVWGLCSPPSHNGRMVASGNGTLATARSDEHIASDAAALNAMSRRVRAAGSRAFHVLQNVAIYERGMRFMDGSHHVTEATARADALDLQALRLGLAALIGDRLIGDQPRNLEVA